MSDKSIVLCLACSQEFEVDDTVYCCPGCGDRGIPAQVSVRPEFRITWHELRVLIIWAEFWASAKDDEEHKKMRQIVYGIADRLHAQHMDGPALTFSQEIAQCRAEFGADNVQVTKSDGSVSPLNE